MTSFQIPQTYDEWRHCITVICRQPLTRSYIARRIEVLDSGTDHITARFVELYGEPQRLKTLEWFKKAQSEL